MPDAGSGGGAGGAVVERLDGVRLPTFYSLQKFMESRGDVPFLVGDMATEDGRNCNGPAMVRCALNQYAIIGGNTVYGLIEPDAVTFYLRWRHSSRMAEAFMRATILNRGHDDEVIQFATGGGAHVQYRRDVIGFSEQKFLRDEHGFFQPDFGEQPSHPCNVHYREVRRRCELYQGGAHYRAGIDAAVRVEPPAPPQPRPTFSRHPTVTYYT